MICNTAICSSGFRFGFLILALGMSVTGCSKSYVVLLENDDGSIGAVHVTTNKGTTVLNKRHEADVIGEEPGKTFTASQEEINQDFGCAFSASPKKPISFYLYFEPDTSKLTHESAIEIPKIIDEILGRSAPDISVINYTDQDEKNKDLGLIRAQGVAALLDAAKLDQDKVSVESRNILFFVPHNAVPDIAQTVEISVR